jgi:hypothetical protein
MTPNPNKQQQLATKISTFTAKSEQLTIALLNCIAKDWFKIDRLRLDKTYLLVKSIINARELNWEILPRFPLSLFGYCIKESIQRLTNDIPSIWLSKAISLNEPTITAAILTIYSNHPHNLEQFTYDLYRTKTINAKTKSEIKKSADQWALEHDVEFKFEQVVTQFKKTVVSICDDFVIGHDDDVMSMDIEEPFTPPNSPIIVNDHFNSDISNFIESAPMDKNGMNVDNDSGIIESAPMDKNGMNVECQPQSITNTNNDSGIIESAPMDKNGTNVTIQKELFSKKLKRKMQKKLMKIKLVEKLCQTLNESSTEVSGLEKSEKSDWSFDTKIPDSKKQKRMLDANTFDNSMVNLQKDIQCDYTSIMMQKKVFKFF